MKTLFEAEVVTADELQESRDRLAAAGISIAVFESGVENICRRPDQVYSAWRAGAVVWGPQEMLDYVSNPRSKDRRLMRELKELGATKAAGRAVS